jgi:hypothetical protein
MKDERAVFPEERVLVAVPAGQAAAAVAVHFQIAGASP